MTFPYMEDSDDACSDFRGNQWALVNDRCSLQGIEAKYQRAAEAPPIPRSLARRVRAKASLILTENLQRITVKGAIERFKRVAPDVYEEVHEFFALNIDDEFGVLDFEAPTIREIIRILMSSEVGRDFYIPRSHFFPWKYQRYGIVRLDGTSPFGF